MKITLMDIMESLNGDNVEDAQAALHEWFVEQSKQVHSNLTNPVVESEDSDEEDKKEVEESIVESEDEDEDKEEVTEADDAEEDDNASIEESSFGNPLEENVDDDQFDALQWVIDNHVVNSEPEGSTETDIGDRLANIYWIAVPYDEDFDLTPELKNRLKAMAKADYPKFRVFDLGSYQDDEKELGIAFITIRPGKVAPNPAEPTFEELVAELSESFKGLETVSDKLQNVEGAQVGEQGKVPVNTKATLPSHKGKDRVGGEPVEIKGKGHNGHALEKAPKVADVKVKNTVQNGKEELKKVADKGDASALLNKRDGKENTQSPISGKGAKGLKN